MGKKTVLTATVAMVFAMVLPPGLALAGEPTTASNATGDNSAGVKSVPESASGSYIVVMKQDPLVTTIDHRADLRPRTPRRRAMRWRRPMTRCWPQAGVATDPKVQDYTNALNGFSAVVSHDQAVTMAADPKVATGAAGRTAAGDQ